jgi:hypothetical protein
VNTIPRWARGPFELILHAEMHYSNGEDFDRRIAIVGYDNAIEVSIHTYLNLHPLQRNNKAYKTADVDIWIKNFHTKLDFLEIEVTERGADVVCSKADFIWYHDVRNNQYHVGGATIPQANDLQGIREAALWVFSLLFDISNVEDLLEIHLAGPTENSLPIRSDEDDRIIDDEFGAVRLAGRIYHTSEVLHSWDPVLYSEVAADIRNRDAASREMDAG